MNRNYALENEVRNNFSSWTSWLVFADWLLEQGDIRGELIMLEHKLRTTELSPEDRYNFQLKLDVSEKIHQFDWLSGYDSLKGTSYAWKHGFVVEVYLPNSKTMLEKLAELCNHPSGRFLKRLNLSVNNLRDEGVCALAQSEYLREITHLYLHSNGITDKGARALAQSEHLRSLTRLDLDNNKIRDEGARALAQSEHLRALTQLRLERNYIGAEGKAALAQSPTLHHYRIDL